jgi:hypothetical protein
MCAPRAQPPARLACRHAARAAAFVPVAGEKRLEQLVGNPRQSFRYIYG